MKYLIINGSPHKGNTWKLVERVKKDISSLPGNSVFAEVHLMDLDLPFCTGCSLCFRKGTEVCPHHEIIDKVIRRIEWADGIIFAVTAFNMQPTALTKNLIDHLCAYLHRPCFFTKKALVISTTAAVGAGKTVNYIEGTLRGIGFNKCYKLAVSSYSWNAYRLNERTRRKCLQTARQFHYDVASRRMHAPKWMILIPYNLFRGMSLHYVKGTEYEYQDGNHWTDPVRRSGIYDRVVKVPFYKKPFGQLFYLMGKGMGKMVTVTYKK